MKAKKYIIVIFILAFFSQSCEEYLKEDLVSNVSAGSYYTTVQGFEDAVKATYSELKPFFGPERGFTMTVFGTDTYTNGADGGHKPLNRYDGQLNPTQGFVRDTWRDFYRGINQANAVLNRAEGLEMDEALKTTRLAETRFLRGLYYFILTQTYGDIHISLEETEGVEITANKTASSEIYSQAIVPDLEFAIDNLPEEQSEYGRVTKPAAEFLLGKVLLTRSYKSFADANDAARAETLLSNVIDNYGFELLDDYAALWDIDNEENSEVVFTVQNSKSQVDENLDGNGHRGHLYFLFEYDVRPGMTRDIANGRPWKRFMPTEYTLGLWDRDVDSRYDKTFKHAWISNNESTIPVWTQEEADAGYVESGLVGQPKFVVGDTAVFIPGPGKDADWDADRQASTRYMVITNDEYTEKLFPSLNKWIDPTRPDRQKTQGQRDFVLMRLGEAYLLRAEARLQQGNASGAADDINVIRVRSAWEGMEGAITISAADITLDFILDERARELLGEGHRWWDLVRVGKLVERVRLHNPVAAPNIQDYHVVRPIPQDQIDRTQGGYPQNAGYPGAGG
ncbi:RagB/SusD family nutrient uptake outer membrane protein [Flexithrix dorotheae]|uniref:RagB/SusD family nutrient uptake outer membrane protein n=1 Tax=Flexithrix dorotheae TaxID=70993 RepID=UPI000378C093|nr:RagB/SusD family nutrient uptake outer membrane protein [Flexithrix dorotheae]